MMNWDALFESIDGKQTRRFLTFLAPDAVFRYGSSPAIVGQEQIGPAVGRVFDQVRSCSHRLLRIWAPPGTTILQGEVTYVRLDGRAVILPFCNVIEQRGGLITRYEIYIDPTPLTAP